jgi:predicted Fe-S protein YdhL (DUF1289 family)
VTFRFKKPAAPDADPGASSPCIGICLLDEGTKLCEGCYRTIEEIAGWGAMSADERRAVNRLAAKRRAEA